MFYLMQVSGLVMASSVLAFRLVSQLDPWEVDARSCIISNRQTGIRWSDRQTQDSYQHFAPFTASVCATAPGS